MFYREGIMIYRTKEENRIKRKLTRVKRKKISLQNEIAVLNLNIAKSNDCNLILRREIILKEIRQLDVIISGHYDSLRNPQQFRCMYGNVSTIPNLGTRV